MSTKKISDIHLFLRSLGIEKARQGLSDKQIAEKANINAKYISLIKNGRRTPKRETLEKIALALGYQLIDFLKVGEAELGETPTTQQEADWKAKYEKLLSKYTDLLEKYNALLEGRLTSKGPSSAKPTSAHTASTQRVNFHKDEVG